MQIGACSHVWEKKETKYLYNLCGHLIQISPPFSLTQISKIRPYAFSLVPRNVSREEAAEVKSSTLPVPSASIPWIITVLSVWVIYM